VLPPLQSLHSSLARTHGLKKKGGLVALVEGRKRRVRYLSSYLHSACTHLYLLPPEVAVSPDYAVVPGRGYAFAAATVLRGGGGWAGCRAFPSHNLRISETFDGGAPGPTNSASSSPLSLAA